MMHGQKNIKFFDILESRSKIPWKFWNVVLGKVGEDQLYRSREKEEVFKKKEVEEYSTKSKKKEV